MSEKYNYKQTTKNSNPNQEKISFEGQYKYDCVPIQLGLPVADAAKVMRDRLNERAAQGYKLSGQMQVNISEAVLIFEKLT